MSEKVGDRSQEQVFQDDLKEIMQELGMQVHARPLSPHRVVQEEVIPYIRGRRKQRKRLLSFVRDISEKCDAIYADVFMGQGY